MDVFALRQALIDDFRHYAESFLTIRDERIREHVQRELDAGLLWPDPPLQLNPAFEPNRMTFAPGPAARPRICAACSMSSVDAICGRYR